MSKITRANIAAARAQRDILVRRNEEVPEKVRKLAELDPDRLPRLAEPAAAKAPPTVGETSADAPPTGTSRSGPGFPSEKSDDTGVFRPWIYSSLHDEVSLSRNAVLATILLSNQIDQALVPMSDYQRARWKILFRYPLNSDSRDIFLVDEDNAGRAEHFIHEFGDVRALPQQRPPIP